MPCFIKKRAELMASSEVSRNLLHAYTNLEIQYWCSRLLPLNSSFMLNLENRLDEFSCGSTGVGSTSKLSYTMLTLGYEGSEG